MFKVGEGQIQGVWLMLHSVEIWLINTCYHA